MICDCCKKRPATQITTQIVDGEKKILYRCGICAKRQEAAARPSLRRPCERCGEREGQIKLIRLREGLRSVSFLCEVCAGHRRNVRMGGNRGMGRGTE